MYQSLYCLTHNFECLLAALKKDKLNFIFMNMVWALLSR